MATESRQSGASVMEALVAQPYEFGFFEAVRLLEQMHPDCAPVGEGRSPSAEPVRFRAHGAQGFPPSDIVGLEVPEDTERPVEMSVAFMSLAGPHGPLPAPYTELMHDQARVGETAFRDVLDLLTHRLIALRYRGRKRHHVGMQSGTPAESTVARYLRAIGGLGHGALHRRLAVPDAALLRYAPLLNQRPPSAHGLSVLLQDYFAAEVAVRPLAGQWVPLAPDQKTHIGQTGQNQSLGTTTVLGERAWDPQAALTVELRVSSFDEYLGFFPEGDAHRSLVDLAQLYLGRTPALQVALTLPTDAAVEVPLSTLLGPRLGRDAWLGAPTGEAETTWVEPHTFTPEQERIRIPLFALLSPDALQAVLDRLPERQVEADQHVVRQGHSADAFYVVVDGEAEVRYQSSEREEPTVLTTLEPGGVFGDRAMMQDRTYEGALVTTRPSRFLVVAPDLLQRLMALYPPIERAFQEEYAPPDEDAGLDWTDGPRESPPAGPQTGLGALLPVGMWRPFYQRGTARIVTAGSVAVAADAAPTSLKVLLRGRVQAEAGTAMDTPGTPLNLNALAADRRPAHTLRATEETALLVLPRAAVQDLLQKHPPIERALRAWQANASPAASPED